MNDQKLTSIRQAESAAKDLLKSVEEEMQSMTRRAQTESVQLMENAKIESRKKEQALLDEYHKKGSDQAISILSVLNQELTNLDRCADAGESKAISYLHEQVQVAYGNR